MTTVKAYPRAALLRIATPLGRDLRIGVAGGHVVSSCFTRHRSPVTPSNVPVTPSNVPVTPSNLPVTPSVFRRVILSLSKDDTKLMRQARREVDLYFKGKLDRFTLPLALDGTPFERDVWRCVANLAFGEFVSYADVARAVGRPFAYRGVARAMGSSPLDLFVPAHRVVGADGKPRGLSPKGTRAWFIRFERNATSPAR